MTPSPLKMHLMPWLLGSLWLVLPACGSDDGDTESAGGSGASAAGAGGASSAGTTSSSGGSGTPTAGTTSAQSCGLGTCNAGQYCNNGLCMNGCLTDANCATGQTCADIDAETKVGTCMNQSQPVAKNCMAFCDKAFACMDPDFVICMQACEGLSAECVACVNDSNCGAGCDEVCSF